MFSSQKPSIASSNLLAPSVSFRSFTSSVSASPFAQILPIFSTPSKHSRHRNARNSIALMRLLHTSHHTPGVYLTSLSIRCSCFPSPAGPLPAALLTSFPATFAASPQLNENSATLSSFAAALTSRVNTNSFTCHSYKKYPGYRVGCPPQHLSALCISALSFPSSGRAFSPSCAPQVVTSLLPHVPSRIFLQSNPMKRILILRRHTPCTQYPVAAPNRTKHRELQDGGRKCVSMRA